MIEFLGECLIVTAKMWIGTMLLVVMCFGVLIVGDAVTRWLLRRREAPGAIVRIERRRSGIGL